MERAETKLKIVFFLTVLIYLVLFGIVSLTRTRNFTYDSMNYVDVARNITAGRGIAQSAFNYNEPHFSLNDPMPAPFTHQPPLYPLSIAAASALGPSHADAALLLSIIAFGIILLASFLMARGFYDERAAYLAVSLLLFSYPLRYVSSYAWSESLGIGFVFLSFLFESKQPRSLGEEIFFSSLAGLFCGLAFATRYALLLAFFVGLIFLVAKRSPHPIRNAVPYVLGFAVPVGLVVIRNWMLAKELFGSALNRPSYTWIDSVAMSADTILHAIGILDANDTVGLLALSLVFCAVAYVVARRNFQELWKPLIRWETFLLLMWIVVYLAFVTIAATQTYLDPIDDRLTAPALVALVLPWSAILVQVMNPRLNWVLGFALASGILAAGLEMQTLIEKPVVSDRQEIDRSARLTWIEQRTSDRDLVIAENAVDVTFLLKRTAVLSFASYPESDHPIYSEWLEFIQKNCSAFDHVYLILRKQHGKEEQQTTKSFGPFITDILHGRTESYPGVFFRRDLGSDLVYEIFDECLNSQ